MPFETRTASPCPSRSSCTRRARLPARRARSTIGRLADAGRPFISVTYGAGGSSAAVARWTCCAYHPRPHDVDADGAPHLRRLHLRRGQQPHPRVPRRGVTSFLALRGDPPAGAAEGETFLGDLRSAAELVQLIHRVQAERVPYTRGAVPGLPGAKRRAPNGAQGHDRGRRVPERAPALARSRARTSTPCSPSRRPARTSPSPSCSSTPTTTCAFVERARRAGVTHPASCPASCRSPAPAGCAACSS